MNPARRARLDAAIDAAYAQVPPMVDCRGLCHSSCGPVPSGKRERERLRERHRLTLPVPNTRAIIAEVRAGGEPPTCPALDADNRCSVYEDRPLLCRLWGAVEDLRCPYGCQPAAEHLTPARAHELMKMVMP